jgi:hypothetical protein
MPGPIQEFLIRQAGKEVGQELAEGTIRRERELGALLGHHLHAAQDHPLLPGAPPIKAFEQVLQPADDEGLCVFSLVGSRQQRPGQVKAGPQQVTATSGAIQIGGQCGQRLLSSRQHRGSV